jgi:hypothetical protein
MQLADLVARAGIPVPERFASFDEAMKSGESFLIRSEHPREFAGESGILESFPITSAGLDEARGFVPSEQPLNKRSFSYRIEKQKLALQAKLKGGSERDFYESLAQSHPVILSQYCSLQQISEQDFLRDVSYSYWKLLGSWNRSVIADNAIPERYHIFTTDVETPAHNRACNYTIVEDGKVKASDGYGMDLDLIQRGAAELIGFYESVRQLPFFDPSHCPMIECQFVNGVHYFLQYHKVRDAEPASFELTRPAEEGEVEASFVRGATPPEGLLVGAAFYYPRNNWVLSESEEASFDYHYYKVFSEIMSRRRLVQFLDLPFDAGLIAERSSNNHLQKTMLFKPKISVAGDFKKLISKPLLAELLNKTEDEQTPARVPFFVVSDGRRALVRRQSNFLSP